MKKFVAAAVGGASVVEAQCPAEFGSLCNPTSPEMTGVAPKVFKAVFETTEGNFTVEVTRNLAPKEADRFYNLVRNGYYDDTRFYRVVKPFVVQWGPSGNPALANVYNPTKCDVPGACFRSSPVIGSNLKGTITFSAESAEDTCKNTENAADICDTATHGTGPLVLATELFINLKDNVHLDASGFGSFGQIVDGMDVVDALYAGYGEMQGGSMGDYLCTRDMAKLHYPNAACNGPNPDMLYSMEAGNTYYDSQFPLLDRINRASIIDDTVAVATEPTAHTEEAAHTTADAAHTEDPWAHDDTTAATDAAHGDTTAATDAAHGGDGHGSGGSGRIPPENPQWPTMDGVGAAAGGMAAISVLVLLITAGCLAMLWIRAKKRAAASTSDTEFGGESTINVGSGFGEK